MASKTEGIALLSMYNDEEEEDEEEEQQQQPQPPPAQPPQQQQQEQVDGDAGGRAQTARETYESAYDSTAELPPYPLLSKSPQNLSSSPSPEIKSLRSPTPPPWRKSQQSSPLNWTPPVATPPARPPLEAVVVEGQKERRGALAIVDYAHDEAAMSPEAEEGEIVGSGRVVVGMEVQTSEVNIEERTPTGTVKILTPSTQAEPPLPSDLPEQSRSETSMGIDSHGNEPEITQSEIAAVISEEMRQDDPLRSFLPPPVTTKCPEELQEKINKFLQFKTRGRSFNEDLRNRKDYRNPDFLQHAVRYQEIDQLGTCFSKDVFDPYGYDESDYYDKIEADMRREMERKEQERKKSPKVDFVSGGTQTVTPALKITTQVPAVASGPISTAPDATRENRQNKKSKWDKIDGDVKNPVIPGGHDNLSAVGVHAAHLTAANAGTGYTAFAQQKRREAEERRLGEKKLEKRS